MSKFGKLTVNVYDYYESDQLVAFAERAKITLEKAESLAREKVYRKLYNTLNNKTPEARAKRKVYNRQRNQLLKQL